MQSSRNHLPKETKPLKMKRKRMEPAQNVISLRIKDDEKRALEKLAKATSKSISEIMREAMDQWRSNRRKLCID